MRPAIFQRGSGWLPAAVVLAVVLVAGWRLIALSLQRHAADAHRSAVVEASQTARAIEAQLQALTAQADAQAARAANAHPGVDAAEVLSSLVPIHSAFWISADGIAVTADPAASTATNGILAEWNGSQHADATPSVLGPTRQGSQWLIAALAPIRAQPSQAAPAQPVAWAAVYTDLDQLLLAIHVNRIKAAGYDFALTQLDPNITQPRQFVSTATAPLSAPVVLPVRLPERYAPASPGSYLQVAVRPRAGWYPVTQIATEIGILAVLAWLLGFGAYDLTHSLQRLRTGLSIYRSRLGGMRVQLAAETDRRRELQKSIDYARYHDSFTGLPNRRYFVDQLDRALREVRGRQRERLGVILIDISRFKLINDSLGHTVGDELMVQAARRFEKAAAEIESVLARWGGDQFALLILDVAFPDAALAFAGVLQDALEAPFELRRHRISVAASMGVTCVEGGAARAEDVVREADVALSMAKKSDARRVLMYSPGMGGAAASLVSLEADLHMALRQNDLRLLFQPIVELQHYRMVGAEALLRWRHPVEGLLLPERFLSIAEEAGLMVTVTRQIIARVCRLAVQWRQIVPRTPFYMSVNLSASSLRDPQLVDFVSNTLREAGLPPDVLKLEVSELSLISNVGVAREALERLHALGVQLMLDDFGTGFSSLNYLQLFPIDYVKIDRPNVDRTFSGRVNSGLTPAMLQMASSMGLTAIAEIVETEEAADGLRKMGCEYGQGLFYSEPVAAEVALSYLRGEAPPKRSSTPAAASGRAEPSATRLTSPGHGAGKSPEDDSPTLVIPIEGGSQTAEVPVLSRTFSG
ncbi:MAG TPA: bifunctional diguanylate cyclase/phosphodiesterase [Steroidobacteraceae bacterium]|jgi:diguanylate cyclase (GGDEF)-like protein